MLVFGVPGITGWVTGGVGVTVTGKTVIVMVAVPTIWPLYITVYAAVAMPLKPAAGLNVTVLSALIIQVPCDGSVGVTELVVEPVGTVSLANTFTVTGVL